MSVPRNTATAAVLSAAVAVLGAPALSSPAAAAPSIDFTIQTNQFSMPTMEFKFQGGKYVWDQKSITTQFKASADTHNNKLLWSGPLRVRTLGVGGSAAFDGKVPEDVRSWSQSGPITLPANFLSAYQAGFASYCDSHGKVGKSVVKHDLSILFSASQGYYKKTKDPQEVQHDAGPETGTHASKTINMPMIVSCGPKPQSTAPRPGDVAADQPDKQSVKSIELSFGGMQPTKLNPTTACKRALLTVTLNANKAGAVKFRLHKKIDDGPLQSTAIDAWAKFDGNAHYVATYQETFSTTKSKHVLAKAEELVNPIGLTTAWKEVTLTCHDTTDGYAGTPSGASPKSQSKRQRAMVAPSHGKGEAKRTHAPGRPTSAPTKGKTASGGNSRLPVQVLVRPLLK